MSMTLLFILSWFARVILQPKIT